jgi:hypothetical protein
MIALRSVELVTTAGFTTCSSTVYQLAGCTTYVKAFSAVAVPPGVVTTTLFAPTVPPGAIVVMLDEETTTKFAVATPPTFTVVAPVKLVPVIVIDVPPFTPPDIGETDEIVGGATYVNAFVAVAVPFVVITETFFAPTVPTGVTAVTIVGETICIFVAGTLSTLTLKASDRSVPTIVIKLPPRVEPVLGVIDVIVLANRSEVLATRNPRFEFLYVIGISNLKDDRHWSAGPLHPQLRITRQFPMVGPVGFIAGLDE